MNKMLGVFALFVVVRLYSGGVCVATWETDNVDYLREKIAFVDTATDHNIRMSGTYTVERINDIENGKRWR